MLTALCSLPDLHRYRSYDPRSAPFEPLHEFALGFLAELLAEQLGFPHAAADADGEDAEAPASCPERAHARRRSTGPPRGWMIPWL